MKKLSLRQVEWIFWAALALGAAVGGVGAWCSRILLYCGLGLMTCGVVFHLIFSRCPFCRQWLWHQKGDTCPYCGAKLP